MQMSPSHTLLFAFLANISLQCASQVLEEGYDREQLQPLTQFRQKHRRTIDGRLCAAAFVQNRQAYTGCTGAPNPVGESGREWCYVEAQLSGAAPAWNYCAPVMDYDAVRASAGPVFKAKVDEVRAWVAKLQKTQRAAEQALDLYEQKCRSRA